MATYIIGDLQGCFDEFQQLLQQVHFNPCKDTLYLVGDLVARGDKSLECLRWVKEHSHCAKTVLGNHDLHLISTALGIKKIKEKDRVAPIFNAPDFAELIDWLRHQPLLIEDPVHDFLVVHAGIAPSWDLALAKQCALEVETWLKKPEYHSLIENMYGDQPNQWEETLTGFARYRYIINVFTRMRYCTLKGELDLQAKMPLEQAPEGLCAWFQLPRQITKPILFGHWASLMGKHTPDNLYGLDTGCVWGNCLTMLRWEDKHYFKQSAVKSY